MGVNDVTTSLETVKKALQVANKNGVFSLEESFIIAKSLQDVSAYIDVQTTSKNITSEPKSKDK